MKANEKLSLSVNRFLLSILSMKVRSLINRTHDYSTNGQKNDIVLRTDSLCRLFNSLNLLTFLSPYPLFFLSFLFGALEKELNHSTLVPYFRFCINRGKEIRRYFPLSFTCSKLSKCQIYAVNSNFNARFLIVQQNHCSGDEIPQST